MNNEQKIAADFFDFREAVNELFQTYGKRLFKFMELKGGKNGRRKSNR